MPQLFLSSLLHFSPVYFCGRLNNGPEDVCMVISSTSEYATLHGKRDFADMIKLRTLR